MAIRFKYDATGVVIPKDKAQQKFGEQLVLNQQKYANNTRQNIYDQQKQGMQNQFQWNLQGKQNDAQANIQDVRGKQALAELNAQQAFGVQNRDAAHVVKMQDMNDQRDLGVFNAQVNSATSMANDALRNPNVPPAVKQKIQALITGKGAVNSAGWSADQKQKYLEEYQTAIKGHLDGIPPTPSMAEQSNKNLTYYNPKTRGYIDKAAADQLPPGEVHVYQNGHLMPGPTQQSTAGSFYNDPKNTKVYDQHYANAKKEIQTENEDSGKTMSPEELHAEASRRMERDYNNKQKNIAAWQASGMPAMSPAGQSPITHSIALAPGHPDYKAPPTPTSQVDDKGYVVMSDGSKVDPRDSAAMKSGGQVRQGILRMIHPDGSPIEQDLSNRMLEAGVTQAAPGQAPVTPVPGQLPQAGSVASPSVVPPAAPGQVPPAMPPTQVGQPSQAGQPADLPQQEGMSPEDEAAIQAWQAEQAAMPQPQPVVYPGGRQPMGYFGKRDAGDAALDAPPLVMPEGKTPYGYFGKTKTPWIADPANMQPPPLPNQQAVDNILFPGLNQGSPVGVPQAVQPPTVQPPTVQPQAMTQPQAPTPEQAMAPAVTTPPVTPTKAGQPQTPQSIHDTIKEANTTFESGTPEQKLALREKLANSETLSGLMANADSGNEDARKALLSAKSEYSPSELVASAKRKAKGSSSDATGAVRDLQDMKKAGKIDDQDYTAAIIENSRKTAKQVYEGVITKSVKSGRLNIHNEETKTNALNAIWDEMGMYDSRSHVRAFQKTPTMDDVITHAATKGKMSRAAAEEWVYSQILARKYAENVQKQFEDSITGNAESIREKKQKEKQDAWSPSKK